MHDSGFQKSAVSVMSDMDLHKHLDAGAAYEFLRMPEEALAEYGAIPPKSDLFPEAQGECVGVLMTQGRHREAWTLGLGVLENHPPTHNLVVNTALALHSDQRFAEALDLLLHNQSVLRGYENAYHIGTSAARCANWEWADKAFVYHLRHAERPNAWFFLDGDVEPWLAHLRESPLTPDVAEGLADPKVEALWLAMPLPRNPVPVDALLVASMPQAFRFWIRVVPQSGLHEWNPSGPFALRRRYLRWQHARFRRNQLHLATAVTKAKAALLDWQLEWAVEHAKQGNYLAARYHTLCALEQELRRFHAFEQALRPLGMDYLFNDLLRACVEDTQVLRKLKAIANQLEQHLVPSRDLLDEIDSWHPRIQETGMFLIQQGHLLRNLERRNEELTLWLQLTQRWSQDPVGFFNAAQFLAQDGQWEKAASLMQAVPSAAHKISLVEELHQKITERNMSKTALIFKSLFYGQRNLGGILRMNNQPLKWIS
ncbi:MAG: hypothetical protein OHK005_00480 [Candidatus Methylacidiphilales bacterium]